MAAMPLAAWCLFVLLIQLVAALDPLEVKGQFFVNPKTNRTFRVLGFDYSVSNDTSGAVDALSNPDACLRDAALMQALNVNAVQVTHINPDLDHDLCVSIFNGAGIYVAVGLEDYQPAWEEDAPAGYNQDFLNRSFAIVDAFKDYENTLAFYVADSSRFSNETFPELQPYMRAAVRDVKSYISEHASRKIPVGMKILFDEPPYTGALSADSYVSIIRYASCSNSSDGDDPSRADFVGFWIQTQLFQERGSGMPPLDLLRPLMNMNTQGANSSVPMLMEGFRNTKLNTAVSSLDGLSPTDDWFIIPMTYDRMNNVRGIFMRQWANTGEASADWGHVDIEGDNTKVKAVYDSLKLALGNLDLEYDRSGATVDDTQPIPSCDPRAISRFSKSWDLPETSPWTQALIDNGVGGGRKGAIVPIPLRVTATVLDSTGAPIRDLAISPLPDTATLDPDASPPSSSAPSSDDSGGGGGSGLSTGAKAGIGVAVPLVVLGVGVAFLLARRRRRRARAGRRADGGEKTHELSSGEKAELASRYNAHETPGHFDAEPRELDGGGGGGGGANAYSELPAGDGGGRDVKDAAVELDASQTPRGGWT